MHVPIQVLFGEKAYQLCIYLSPEMTYITSVPGPLVNISQKAPPKCKRRWKILSPAGPLLLNNSVLWKMSINVCWEVSCLWTSFVAQIVKNLPAMQETQVRSLSQEDHLQEDFLQMLQKNPNELLGQPNNLRSNQFIAELWKIQIPTK